MSLHGKTLFITGGSRGIGLAIALRAARDGANVAIAAKTSTPHPKLPGTIYTAAEAIEAAGGSALPLVCDVRDADAIDDAVRATAAEFGGIDICINNASAIQLSGTEQTTVSRFDLMHQVNVRATFLSTKACLPWLKESGNPIVMALAPPLNLNPRWFAPHVAYTISKYGMSMCVLGMAEEFRAEGIGVMGLWPRTVVATAAVRQLPEALQRGARRPEIMADAAWHVLTAPALRYSGRFLIDEDVLREHGVRDFSGYAVDTGSPLETDLFLDDGGRGDHSFGIAEHMTKLGEQA